MTSRRSERSVEGSFLGSLRRRLDAAVGWSVRGFLTLWFVAAGVVVAAFITPPRDQLRAADWQLDGGAVSGFEVAQPKMIQGGPQPVWVVRLEGENFSALGAVCEHQHCVLRWNPKQSVFSCPCHHGTFDITGAFLDGPQRRPLRSFFVNVKAGRVRVHLRREIGERL